MAAGDFSQSVLLDIRMKAEEMWADSRLSADYKANAEAAVAVKTNSSARFNILGDSDKDHKARITFINPCAVTAEDCETNCELDENELEVDGKEYELTLCKKSGFSVNAEKVRTNSYEVEEQAANGLALAVKELDEWWAQQVLVSLKAFSGINVSPEPYTYAAGTTTVPSVDWNLDMIPNIMEDAILNKMRNPYYISNGLGGLWTSFLKARLNSGNAEGKGDAEYIKQLRMYFDQWNFIPAGLTEDLFAVSNSAVAFVTKTRHSDTPTLIGGSIQQTRYTVPSSVIPGVKYDVFYGLKCITTGGNTENIFHTWRVQTRGGIFLNPEGCPVNVGGTNYDPTGVLSYSKGA